MKLLPMPCNNLRGDVAYGYTAARFSQKRKLKMRKFVLVTGGAGYIGSHTCVELSKAGYDYIIIDNFCNSSLKTIDRINQIIGREIKYINADVRDKQVLDRVFEDYEIDSVMHFAGYKAVGESVLVPITYYKNNIDCLLTICEAMIKYNVKKIIFSSSATVYSGENSMPVDENGRLGCTNPYGWTKLMIEQMLKDLYISDNEWSIVLLRYFNPIGAHKSGLIGEEQKGTPNNLVPYIAQVASARLKELHVFGGDYPTKDGSGIRDYIHVVDLAKGHIDALNYIQNNKGIEAINLGTGNGYSVFEVIRTFENICGKVIPYVIENRRVGDIAVCFANVVKANILLGWRAALGIEEMCEDMWRWETNRA